jgi:hypothetical protein
LKAEPQSATNKRESIGQRNFFQRQLLSNDNDSGVLQRCEHFHFELPFEDQPPVKLTNVLIRGRWGSVDDMTERAGRDLVIRFGADLRALAMASQMGVGADGVSESNGVSDTTEDEYSMRDGVPSYLPG